jgi:Flp pilus assembly protein TadG
MNHTQRDRRGAVAVEGAIVMALLLLVFSFTFDVGLAVVRYNFLSTAARTVARQAVVHGSAAAPELATWGPTAVAVTASAPDPAAEAAAPLLATMSLDQVAVAVDWIDGGNREGDRVRVTLSFDHPSLVPLLGFVGSFHLRAESTMQIVH